MSVSGNAGTVTNGVYTTGDQTISGTKTFNSTITGSISGNAGTVTNGVYTTGDQTISGTKTFNSTINGNANTASFSTTQAFSVNNGTIATTAFVRSIVPAGVILMWSGSIASIPSGWVLCDGTNSTPNLRDRFIVGAGSTYAVNATGGSANAVVVSHTHTATSAVTDPGHFHFTRGSAIYTAAGITFGANSDTTDIGTTDTKTTGITVATTVASAGVSGTNANLPPYFALAYIMKT
jgi:microcystin-dependent protein